MSKFGDGEINPQTQKFYAQNMMYINPKVEGEQTAQNASSSRRRTAGQTGFKIMEKINTIMQRFFIFIVQCKPIANQLCKAMRKNESSYL